MKKTIALMLVLTLTLALCACGAKSQEGNEAPSSEAVEAPAQETSETTAEATAETAAEESTSPVLNIGVLTMLNMSEQDIVDYYKAIGTATAALLRRGEADRVLDELPPENPSETQFNITYYDSLDAMLMALNAGDIDMLSTYNSTADYLVATNDQLVKLVNFDIDQDSPEDFKFAMVTGILNNSFSFMMMEGNESLRDEFDEAITAMEDEGLLHSLIQEQMLAVVDGNDPKPAEMPVIEGADTIKVAVTGSLPPMDYVAADGTPAGYNTAVLAEVSKRINKNIELVVVDSIGRAAALSSGTVDAVFWTRSNDMSNMAANSTEEERAKGSERVDSKLSPDELETIKKINELIDYASIGQNDMPDGTIITKSYFKDSIVPVVTKTGMEKMKTK